MSGDLKCRECGAPAEPEFTCEDCGCPLCPEHAFEWDDNPGVWYCEMHLMMNQEFSEID